MSGDKEGKGQQADGPHLAGEESRGPERFFSDFPGCRAVSKLASHDPSPFYPRLLTGTLKKLTPRSLPPKVHFWISCCVIHRAFLRSSCPFPFSSLLLLPEMQGPPLIGDCPRAPREADTVPFTGCCCGCLRCQLTCAGCRGS